MYQCKLNGVTTLLNAATATGAGDAFVTPREWRESADGISWQVILTGSPSAMTVDLEGSLDNTNWSVLDSQAAASTQLNHFTNPVSGFIRANVTGLSGGSTPTVTVKVQKG